MFDPSVHEAFAVGEGEDGKILEVYQKGYLSRRKGAEVRQGQGRKEHR